MQVVNSVGTAIMQLFKTKPVIHWSRSNIKMPPRDEVRFSSSPIWEVCTNPDCKSYSEIVEKPLRSIDLTRGVRVYACKFCGDKVTYHGH